MGSTGGIAFAAASGCYLVESNQGHFGDDMRILLSEPTVGAYRASAQSARYSWELAAEMYGARTAPRLRASAGAAGRRAVCSASSSAPTSGRARCRTSWATPRRGRSGFSVQAHAARVLGPQMARCHRRGRAGRER